MMKTLRLLATVVAGLLLPSGVAWAVGFELGQAKEDLKLDYEVSAYDHDTGRVTVTLKLADEGRLKPLNSVDLVVGSEDGTGHVDLSIALQARDEDGNKVYRVHIHRKLADRAEIQLRTSHLDGKIQPRTWYYHVIKLAPHIVGLEPFKTTIKGAGQKTKPGNEANAEQGEEPDGSAPPASPSPSR